MPYLLSLSQAPEHLGAIVGVLISGGACDRAKVSGMIAGFLKANLEDEYASPDTAAAYARFQAVAPLN